MKIQLLALAALTSVGGLIVSSSIVQKDDAQPLEFPAASPQSTLKQRVGLTDIEVSYGRPSMKGRTIFGGLEPFGALWRTGANNATKVTFSTDVKFAGADVPAGTYALFSIPGEKEWTVVLNTVVGQFGTYSYDEAKDLVRVNVTPQTLTAPVETLAFGIGDLRTATANLYFEWETTRVTLPIETNLIEVMVPQIEAAMAGEGERPFFAAAMFYYENDVHMGKAAEWINEGLKAEPNAFWMMYRKGLILEKAGDKKGAIEAAKASMEAASEASGNLKAEYLRLNEALIARCQ